MWKLPCRTAPFLCAVAVLANAFAVFGSELTVHLSSTQPIPETVLEAMKAEVDRLISPADLTLAWRSGATRGESFQRLVAGRFLGSCVAEPTYAVGQGDLRRLAHTAVTDGRIQPFASVDCHALRKVLSNRLASGTPAQRDELMGMAMGRVLAHELYHILVGTRDHSANGAAKACFGAADLMAADFSFDGLTLAQLRPARPENPADSFVLSTADAALEAAR
jgi:hypothetical protein